jgi:hypothetical protein
MQLVLMLLPFDGDAQTADRRRVATCEALSTIAFRFSEDTLCAISAAYVLRYIGDTLAS